MPVLGRDLHHLVDARIVTDLHLGQAEVGTLARVARHDVVDDGSAVRGGHLAHQPELRLRAEGRVDPRADPVEVPVHTRRHVPARDAAGPFDRSGMHRVDPDGLEHPPEVLARQHAEERLAGPRDHREGVRREPDRRLVDRGPGVRAGERPLRHAAHAGELGGNRAAAGQHRLLLQPVDVFPLGRVPAHTDSPFSAWSGGAAESTRRLTRRSGSRRRRTSTELQG